MMKEELTDNALEVLRDRYFLRDEKGEIIENAEGLFTRVSRAVAQGEQKETERWEEEFYSLMSNLLFLPNSPTLMNAGLPEGQLSACFVLPVEDSLKGIFTTLYHASLIHQSGGGTGYNFSRIRPRGSMISLSKGTSSGPLSFISVYDEATAHVKQGGKRRGANMGILNVDHPEIEDFIWSKVDGSSLSNFNLSVGISDAFMNCVRSRAVWTLKDPNTGKVVKELPAYRLWEAIVMAAWTTGDPGLIFLDTINRNSPFKKGHGIRSTNPCGEVPLEDYESCNLGSVNLSRMICKDNGRWRINWHKLGVTVQNAIRFLDNVITCNYYLLPEVRQATLNNRKIGLGVMGWAEMLFMLEIPYASGKAVVLANDLMRFIQRESYRASRALAQQKGVFPSWKESRFYPENVMRNATCNSIAPTGSIGIIANTTYSIEPMYALSYTRKGILEDKSQNANVALLQGKLTDMGFGDERTKELIKNEGNLSRAHWIPGPIKELFKTSLEIHWDYHLRHQKAFQEFTDNAVSKTINLPENTPESIVGEIYMKAWEYGLKGITIYRDQSKNKQVLNKSCGVYPASC